VCIDGASLTVNDVAKNRFGVNLIPHTLEVTTLGGCQAGTQVNVEVDITRALPGTNARSRRRRMKPIPLKPEMKLNSIDELLADLRAGRMVVLMDDEDRENEGDLIIAAEHVRAEDINFMAHYGRGLICLTLTRERCRQLRLPLMVSDTNVDHRTNFTVSIEAAEGVTTGISAHDRAHTIRTAVRRDARAEDLRQPGHIFPLMAQPGGCAYARRTH
jgi:3,4-dihydroxy-2-butanone 4-phosphate synthase